MYFMVPSHKHIDCSGYIYRSLLPAAFCTFLLDSVATFHCDNLIEMQGGGTKQQAPTHTRRVEALPFEMAWHFGVATGMFTSRPEAVI